MAELESGISALQSALARSSLMVNLGSADESEINELQEFLPVTEVLREWYLRSAPLEFEIPWAVEWLSLFAPSEVVESQVGYRWTGEVGGDEDEEWNPRWLAIGECSADPVIADTGTPETPILMAIHGTGSWKPLEIAPSLADFLLLLTCWVNTLDEFGGRIRDENGELRLDFLESLRKRLSGVIPDSCIENIVFLIRPGSL